MTYFKISADDLRTLLIDQAILNCLKSCGVDNWIGYMENREEFIASQLDLSIDEVRESNLQLSDVADNWMQNYEILSQEEE